MTLEGPPYGRIVASKSPLLPIESCLHITNQLVFSAADVCLTDVCLENTALALVGLELRTLLPAAKYRVPTFY